MNSSSSFFCHQCGIIFQQLQALKKHKKYFCQSSKYGNIDSLQKNFEQVSKGKDISMYGRMSMVKQGNSYDYMAGKPIKDERIDKQYQTVLRKINAQEEEKLKMKKEKEAMYKELSRLNEEEKKVTLQAKKQQLSDIILRKQQMAKEQEVLQKQIYQFYSNKSMFKSKVSQLKNQQYYDGKKVGKVAKQREILQKRKQQIENKIELKNRQHQKIKKYLQKSIYSDHHKNQSIYKSKIQQQPTKLPTYQHYHQQVQPKASKQILTQSKFQPSISRQLFTQQKNDQNQSRFNKKKQSNLSNKVQSNLQCYLRPEMFQNIEKIQQFNFQQKNKENPLLDILIGQQYDSLNALAKIPKGSQLYDRKIKQYREIQKLRSQLKQKIYKQRVSNMKSQFEFKQSIKNQDKQHRKWVQQHQQKFKEKVHAEKYGTQYQSKEDPRQLKNTTQKIQNLQNKQSCPQILQGKKRIKEKKVIEQTYGYKISIIKLINYTRKKPIQVKVILKQENSFDSEGMFFQFTTVMHDDIVESKSNPFTIDFKNCLDSLGSIVYNESFLVPINLQTLHCSHHETINLFIILMEKDRSKMSSMPHNYGWYCMKITHFGQIKEGKFSLSLYYDQFPYPQAVDMNTMKLKLQQKIVIELQSIMINQFHKNEQKQSKLVKKPLTSSINKEVRPNSIEQNKRILSNNSIQNDYIKFPSPKKNLSEQSLLVLKQMNPQWYIQNNNDFDAILTNSAENKNFNIYISGLRTLPGGIGPVKFQVILIDHQNRQMVKRQEKLCNLQGDIYNPSCSFCMKIRNTKLSNSTIILIRILSISIIDLTIEFLGFSVFNLFYDKNQNPIQSNIEKDCYMVHGLHQIPIFWHKINRQYILNQQVLQLVNIPCASILLGIIFLNNDNNYEMPKYTDKGYNNSLFSMNAKQIRLFKYQYHRNVVSCTNFVADYFHRKGIKNYTSDEMIKYLDQMMSFNKENVSQLINLDMVSQYIPQFGLRLCIDYINLQEVMQEHFYYFCMVQLIDRSRQFDEEYQINLNCTYKIDLNNSQLTNITFLDGEMTCNPQFNINSALLVEVNKISCKEKLNSIIQGVCFCVIPLFQQNGDNKYVRIINDNKFQCYNEDITVWKKQLIGKRNLRNILSKRQKTGKKSDISLSIRLLNETFLQQQPFTKIQTNSAKYQNVFKSKQNFEQIKSQVRDIIIRDYNIEIE